VLSLRPGTQFESLKALIHIRIRCERRGYRGFVSWDNIREAPHEFYLIHRSEKEGSQPAIDLLPAINPMFFLF
jgi:hypothetical protein